MVASSTSVSVSARSLSILRSVGAWMTIAPEQTYVASSIRGLGACKSLYCRAERRDLPVRSGTPGPQLAALLLVAVAASGLLSGFATHRIPAEARDMAEPDQLGPGIVDCQKSAAPVSPGAPAKGAAAAVLACGGSPAVVTAAADGASSGTGAGAVVFGDVIGRAGMVGRVGIAGG